MKPLFRNLVRGGVLAAALSSRLLAGEPASSGKVLVFEHGGVLEGDVERVGGRFRVRSGGGETFVPAAGVLGLAADKEAAFQLWKQRANLKDPKEHVRLARWCQAQGLRSRAVDEAEAALALRPGDRWLLSFRDELKSYAAMAVFNGPPAIPAPAPAPPAGDSAAVPIDFNPESRGLFVTKVQPILMNACAKCHTGEYGGKFKLTQAVAPGNSTTMNTNMAAVSAAIDREQPAASPLLIKAVSVHGEADSPPLKDRQTAAYRYLEEWVRLATGSPVMPKPPAALAPAVIADAQPLPPRSNGFASDADVKPVAAKPGDPPAMPAAPADTTKTPAQPVPGDPFDPAIFNQQSGPKKP
jgi:hypothetical protein